jgi:hypothetical protein
MPADQAAGLRRRGAQQPLRGIHCFFDAPESTLQLARALHRLGLVPLLVDMQGRLHAGSAMRSLFDWKQQIERGHLHTLPLAHGEGWYAPGVRADEPALRSVAHAYDCLLFDHDAREVELALMQDAALAAMIEVRHSQESMQRAYALLKTLSGTRCPPSIGLLGDLAACEQVRTACRNFLGQPFAQSVYSAAHEDDAFAALAVRMTHEEASLTAR